MKIVHCFFTAKTGGAQILAVSLLNELCKDHDVALIIVNDQRSDYVLEGLDEKVAIYFINRPEGSMNPFPLIRLNWLLLKLKPDIIHCHEANMARIIKVRTGKLIYTIHDIGLEVSSYHRYHSLIAISDAVYRDVHGRTSVPLGKVYNGISLQCFDRRRDYSPTHGSVIKIVQVSRLMHEKKGQAILLNALHELVYNYGITNLLLDFVGGGGSRDYLSTLSSELGLNSYVRFLGEKDRDWLYEHLCDYHLLVQPSLYEGFGLTIVEGFAAGLPVLASDIDGPAEIIDQLPAGFLFETGNFKSCAQALFNILQLYKNENMEDRMNTTLQLVAKRYSIQHCTSQYLQEYQKLAG